MSNRIENEELRAMRDELGEMPDAYSPEQIKQAITTLAANIRTLCWHIDRLWQKLETVEEIQNQPDWRQRR